MGKLWIGLGLFLSVFFTALTGGEIRWFADLEEAKYAAKQEKKYVLLYFTGSDWCPWCQRMHSEILASPEFQKMAGPLFVFVLVDFPRRKNLEHSQREKNRELKRQYNVEGFPTLVLLDAGGAFITTLGYLPSSGQKYAQHLKDLVVEYQKLAYLDLKELSNLERQKVYAKNRDFGFSEDVQTLKEENKEEDPFLILEEYNLLKCRFSEGVLNSTGAKLKAVLARYLKNLQKEDSEKALFPLLDYIRTYGSKDKEHLWQLEMLISRFFYQRGNKEKALLHAKASYKAAPLMIRKDLADVILFIKRKTKKT
ncbi:MAG: thioredoxin family protein [Parachlamydiales bacterium]|jgi:protein disulfide-isomerase